MFSIKNMTGSIGSYIFANQPKIKHKLKSWRNFWKYKLYYSSTSGNKKHLSFWNNVKTDRSAQKHAVIQQWNNYINEQYSEAEKHLSGQNLSLANKPTMNSNSRNTGFLLFGNSQSQFWSYYPTGWQHMFLRDVNNGFSSGRKQWQGGWQFCLK